MVVPDASIVAAWLMGTRDGIQFGDRVLEEGETLHAPHIIDLEVVQALRRSVRRGVFSHQGGIEAIGLLLRLPISRYSHEPLLPRVWQLRANFTPYDAAYVALAEALEATLVTRDARLAKTSGHRAKIEVV